MCDIWKIHCRKTLYEPRDILLKALDYLQEETNQNLPEGQLRLQIKETLSQLTQFMKTLGCEDVWKIKTWILTFLIEIDKVYT